MYERSRNERFCGSINSGQEHSADISRVDAKGRSITQDFEVDVERDTLQSQQRRLHAHVNHFRVAIRELKVANACYAGGATRRLKSEMRIPLNGGGRAKRPLTAPTMS